jgi:hypothetical protein
MTIFPDELGPIVDLVTFQSPASDIDAAAAACGSPAAKMSAATPAVAIVELLDENHIIRLLLNVTLWRLGNPRDQIGAQHDPETVSFATKKASRAACW